MFFSFFILKKQNSQSDWRVCRTGGRSGEGPWVRGQDRGAEWRRALGQGSGQGGGVSSSLVVVVAALQVFALDVSSAVVGARKLDAILVHAPADTTLPATRGLALWGSREEDERRMEGGGEREVGGDREKEREKVGERVRRRRREKEGEREEEERENRG